MSYSKQTWADGSGGGTPITAARLGHIEDGLAEHDAAFVRKGDLVLNVADYGAVGDGAADDTSALQSALTAARSIGARLRFGYGKTYIVSGSLNPLGVYLDGFGATVKVKNGVTTNFNVFQSSGAFTATGLTVDLNKTNTTDPGVDTQGMAFYTFNGSGWSGRVVIREVAVVNGYQPAIRFSATAPASDPANSPLGRALVDNVYVTACKFGVMVGNVSDVTVRDCRIVSVTGDAIWASNPNRLAVRGNTILNPSGRGISTAQALDSRFSDNVVRGCGDYGMSLGGGSTTVTQMRRNVVSGNVVEGCTGVGIIVDPTQTGATSTVLPSYCTIVGNTCNNNGSHGIYLNNSQWVSVTGNVCRSNGSAGIAVAAADTVIDGNSCTGNARGIALYGNASFPNYGRHRIGVNTVAGNTTSGYYVESASVTDVSWASLTTTNPAP
jgi:parallel beta-helix repeat protein